MWRSRAKRFSRSGETYCYCNTICLASLEELESEKVYTQIATISEVKTITANTAWCHMSHRGGRRAHLQQLSIAGALLDCKEEFRVGEFFRRAHIRVLYSVHKRRRKLCTRTVWICMHTFKKLSTLAIETSTRRIKRVIGTIVAQSTGWEEIKKLHQVEIVCSRHK